MDDIATQLMRLDQLRAAGTLTEAEFQSLKAKLISDGLAPPRVRSASRLLKVTIISAAITLLVGTVFLFPLLGEGASNECSALEQHLLTTVSKGEKDTGGDAFAMGLMTLMQRASNGSFASANMKRVYPHLPPVIGCTVGYYRMLFTGSLPNKPAFTTGEADNSSSSGKATPVPALPGFTVVSTDRTLGNPKAKVTVIEYAAPSCPVCANFNAQSFPQLRAKYIDTGRIFYVFRVFPLRPDDGSAEKIARCLPEDKYFSFIDLLFRSQPKWDVEYGVQSPEGVHDGLVLLGHIAGMSREQVDQCIDNNAEDDRINKVSADGEARYSITGTPTFILNGTNVGSGNIPFDTMAKLIDADLASNK